MLPRPYMTKQKLTVAWTFLSMALFFASGAVAKDMDVKVQCGQDEQAGHWWNYCEYQVPGSTSKDVLYYFHGIGGSEYEWQNFPFYDKTYSLWGNSAPTVVTVSYGSAWLLAEQNSSGVSGLYEHFIHTALPYLETQLKLTPERRLLMGLSMGGFNASQLYLKNPELFNKVALACPALSTVSPYASREEIAAYQQRTGALDYYIARALGLSATYFPDEASWQTAAPVQQAQQRTNPTYPPLFVSGGMQDQYGFQEGGKAFVDAAAANGATAKWTPVQGPHCTFDIVGNALFLLAK